MVAPAEHLSQQKPVDQPPHSFTRPQGNNGGHIGRELPHDIQSEQLHLSACMLDGASVVSASIMAQITATTHYDSRHNVIFGTILDLYSRNQPTTVNSVAEELRRKRTVESAGGWNYLSEVSALVPTTAEAPKFIASVRTYATLRSLIRSRTASVEACYGFFGDLDPFIADLAASEQAAMGQNSTQDEETVAATCETLLAELGVPKEQRKSAVGEVSWGLLDLDAQCGKLAPGTLNILAGMPSTGKAQPLNALVLTPNGFVPMGTLHVGDEVIGGDGKPTKIVAIHPQGKKPIFTVKISDGTETQCCADHLWLTTTKTERRGLNRNGTIKTLAKVRATLRRSDGHYRNHALPPYQAIQFKPQKALLMHPWLLGVLIGDGSLKSGNTMFCKPERDVQERLMALLPAEDIGIITDGGRAVRIKRRIRNNESSRTKAILVQYDLCVGSENRFIPREYLVASPADRLELLRGLMDTDSWCSHTNYEFSSSSRQLAHDVMFLVRSLGGVCTVNDRITKYTHQGIRKDGARSWRVLAWFDNGIIAASSQKHLKRLGTKKIRHVHRSIVEINAAGEAECQCITVANADGLYFTNDFIVTHNSCIADQCAWCAASKCQDAVVIHSYEMMKREKIIRIAQQESRLNMDKFDGVPVDMKVRFLDAVREIKARKNLHIFERDTTINRLIARTRSVHQKNKVGLIVVDFLQYLSRLEPNVGKERSDEKIGRITAALKSLAKECECPVLLLSSLNREGYKNGLRPTLASLRASGEIESDADVVMILHWPKTNPRTGQNQDPHDALTSRFYVEALQEKGRSRGVHQVGIEFDRNATRFDNICG